MRIRGLVGAADIRFGRDRRLEVSGKSTETPQGPGKRRVPPWRSEARGGRQGGIWRRVRWVRHPRRLKPSLVPSHAPVTAGWGGVGWERWRGRGPQTWSERRGSRRQQLGQRAARRRTAAGWGGRRRPRPWPRERTPRSSGPRRPAFLSTGPRPPQVRSQDSQAALPTDSQSAVREIRDLLSALPTSGAFGKANFRAEKQNIPRSRNCRSRQLSAESLYYTSPEGWRARPRPPGTPSFCRLTGGG